MGKKDFSGKNKNSKTYDKDWVFVKNKHTKGPNDSAGAWMTQKQARQAHEQKRQDNAYQASLDASYVAAKQPPVPGVPGTPPATAPILSSQIDGGLPTPPQTGDPKNGIPPIPQEPAPDTQIPNWWINQAVVNPTDPNAQFANVANALLPTLAPEDQRTLASYLATNFKDVYGGYANTNFGVAPTQITDAVRKQYLSPQRSQLALTLLDKMKTASGSQDMGAGYGFLQNAVKLINQFMNPNGVMGRENYNQFTNAVSSLVGQGNSNKDLAAYANLAQLFNLPKFSAGPIISNTPNNKLFS